MTMPEPNAACLALMTDVVAEAMESMAFVETLPVVAPPPYDDDAMWVTLLVHDPVQGELHLVMEKELVHYLTEIVYGGMQVVNAEQGQYDLLAEMLNTVAGCFLGKCLPRDQCFQLGLPEIGHVPYLWPNPPLQCWHFQVDGMHFSLAASGETLLALLAEAPPNDPMDDL